MSSTPSRSARKKSAELSPTEAARLKPKPLKVRKGKDQTSDPYPPQVLHPWEHAVSLYSHDAFPMALTEFERMLEVYEPATAVSELWANVGIISARLGENTKALKALTHALKLAPECSIYWFLAGICACNLGQYRRAKALFECCEHSFPDGAKRVDYKLTGLDFVLLRDDVFNYVRNAFELQHAEKHGLPLPKVKIKSIKSLLRGQIFKP
ncbi:hypothetical protein EJ06DRAFT_571979 [Trichodelitschia bisporula]|uniref:Uncharacterized protein n=1 Tax=Trichodelitschia bisporula TaxID=703511 RepID=A0A6G1I5S4_9PEZI|nr:hypothetical protein EJ06DRAFT_571979 [Trichodelitschia bisporula]